MNARNPISPAGHKQDNRLTVGYVRVSTPKAEQQTSLKAQVEAATSDWQVDLLFVEICSAKETGSRPEFEKMLQLVETGKVKSVRATMQDRIARNQQDLDRLLSSARLMQCTVQVGECLDLASDDFGTETQVAFTGFMAAQFSAIQRHKALASYKQRRAAGKPVSRAPFGYRISADKSQLEPDPDQWTLAQALWKMLERHEFRTKTVINVWREEGYPPIPLKSPASIRDWATNPVLRGDLVYFGRSYRLSRKERELGVRDPSRLTKTIRNAHKALVTNTEWDQAQRVISIRKGGNRTEKGGPTMFRGLTYCRTCGKRLHAKKTEAGTRVYACTNSTSTYKCPACYKSVKETALIDACFEAIAKRSAAIRASIDEERQTLEPTAEEQEILANIQALQAVPDQSLVADALADAKMSLTYLRETQGERDARAEEFADHWADPALIRETVYASPKRDEMLRALFLEFIERIDVDATAAGGPSIVVTVNR